jgi:uncharacterized membrane protein YagU involved in acid resistance
MTVYQEVVGRVRGNGGDDEPAPAQVGRRVLEGVFGIEVAERHVLLLTHAVHWTYGIAWGGVYGVVLGTVDVYWLWAGLVFGTAVWLAGYAVLPALKVYEPIWTYGPKTLAVDLSYHLVYGLGVAITFATLAV